MLEKFRRKIANQKSFSDKISFVTGGASGIGQAICLELGCRDSVVIVADKDLKGAQETGRKLEKIGKVGEAVFLDISNEQQFHDALCSVVKRYGRLDYLFNVAGISLVSEIRDIESQKWKDVIDVNMMGTVYGSKMAYDIMLRQGYGHIVNIASAAGLMAQPTTFAYTMSKHAIVGFTKCLIAEARDFNVDVTLVCPGYVQSNIFTSCELVNVAREDIIALVPFNPMDTAKAAAKVVHGVSKRKQIVVFPFHAKFAWALCRMFPSLSIRMTGPALREFRKVRRETSR